METNAHNDRKMLINAKSIGFEIQTGMQGNSARDAAKSKQFDTLSTGRIMQAEH
jgi:hypothetical protein